MNKGKLSRFESGKGGSPTVETISRIASALEVDIEVVLRDES